MPPAPAQEQRVRSESDALREVVGAHGAARNRRRIATRAAARRARTFACHTPVERRRLCPSAPSELVSFSWQSPKQAEQQAPVAGASSRSACTLPANRRWRGAWRSEETRRRVAFFPRLDLGMLRLPLVAVPPPPRRAAAVTSCCRTAATPGKTARSSGGTRSMNSAHSPAKRGPSSPHASLAAAASRRWGGQMAGPAGLAGARGAATRVSVCSKASQPRTTAGALPPRTTPPAPRRHVRHSWRARATTNTGGGFVLGGGGGGIVRRGSAGALSCAAAATTPGDGPHERDATVRTGSAKPRGRAHGCARCAPRSCLRRPPRRPARGRRCWLRSPRCCPGWPAPASACT